MCTLGNEGTPRTPMDCSTFSETGLVAATLLLLSGLESVAELGARNW